MAKTPRPVIISYKSALLISRFLPDIKRGMPNPLSIEGLDACTEFWKALNLAVDDALEEPIDPKADK